MPSLVILRPTDIGGENHGLLVQHVSTLAELLRCSGWAVDDLGRCDPDLAARVVAADLVLIQMLAAPEVEGIIRARRRRGLPTVFEITDNFLGVDDPRRPYGSPLVRQRLLYHASLCDALQAYAPGLADLFLGVAPATILFDPYVPIAGRPRRRPAGFVVGWGGTRSHAADVAALAGPVRSLCASHPHANFAFMGSRELYDAHFADLPEGQSSFRPFGSHQVYLDFVAGLHVGLGPLEDGPFNAARTDTRFATYAAQGAAAVLQDSPAYRPHAKRARLFGDGEALRHILEELHAEPAKVAALAQAAYDWARRARSRVALARQRDAAYRALIVTDTAPIEGGDAQAAAELATAERSDPETALAVAEQLLRDLPGCEQAHLLAARSLEAMGRHADALAHVERHPVSDVYSDAMHEVAAHAADRVAPSHAHRHVEAIASPFLRARLSHKDPETRSREVLVHQPYDHFALQLAIRRAKPGSAELARLRERACLVAPESVDRQHRPARLTAYLPR